MKNEQDELYLLPKADLHVHLNGAISTNTAKKLLAPVVDKLPEWFDINTDLQINGPVNGLQEYFKPWHALKKLPYSKECLDLMVESALESLSNDKVNYVELRNSPFNISEINKISLEEALSWLIDSIDKASSKIGIEAKLILSLSRYNLCDNKINNLRKAIQTVKFNGTLVGVDLSGDEDLPVVPEANYFFRKAKHDYGLGITIHAGETGKIENIYWAINECEADRIAHGLAAAESEELMGELRDRNICLEICLASNLLTRAVQNIAEHPINEFIKNRVPFVLCSDNPCINNSNLSKNYSMFCNITENSPLISTMHEMQQKYSFKVKK